MACTLDLCLDIRSKSNLFLSCIDLFATRCWNYSPANDIDEGYRLGQVGLAIYHKFQVKVWLPRLTAAYYSGVHTFKHPLPTILEPLQCAWRVGIETGDMESAFLCGLFHCYSQLETIPLHQTEASNQMTVFEVTKPILQFIHNLMGRGDAEPTSLSGEAMNEEDMHRLKESGNQLYAFAHFYVMVLGYMFGDCEQAVTSSKIVRLISGYPSGALNAALIVFFDGLVAIRNSRTLMKRSNLRLASKQLRRIRHWAKHAPHTFLCRQFLLEAQIAAVTGDHASVGSKYVNAIALAKDAGFIFQIALGNELAGKYYLLERKDEVSARPYLREALRHYELWGAKAKLDHLAGELKLTNLTL
jgi:hypothetical protein